MAVGDIYQVNIRYSMSGQELLNVLHFRATTDTGAGDPAKSQLVANYIADASNPANFMAQLLDVLPDDCTVNTVTAQLISPTRLSYRSALVLEAGTADPSGNQAQDVVITKRTDKAGRDQVGSIHMPGIPASEMSQGKLGGVFLGAVLNAWEKLIGPLPIEAGTFVIEQVIIHPGLAPGSSDFVTNYVVQPTTRVMQRRVVGRGI